MRQVRLNNGVMIPVNETERIVTDALEAGYRMIDTAASYFNEEQVGNALRHSGLKREYVFVTTKLWVQDYEYGDALRAFDLSMKKLGGSRAALQGGTHPCHRSDELQQRAPAGPLPAQ